MRLTAAIVVTALSMPAAAHEAVLTVSTSPQGSSLTVQPAESEASGPLGTVTLACDVAGWSLSYAVEIAWLSRDVTMAASRLALRLGSPDGRSLNIMSADMPVVTGDSWRFPMSSVDDALVEAIATGSDLEVGLSTSLISSADVASTHLQHGFRFVIDPTPIRALQASCTE